MIICFGVKNLDIKKFVLSYYKNATSDFYITHITNPKEALNLHSHAYFQVYYVLQGTIVHHMDKSSAQLSCGDMFILPPDIPHYIEKKDDAVSFYAMSFMPDYFFAAREERKLVCDFLHYLVTAARENILPKLKLAHGDTMFAETVFERIMEEFSKDEAGKKEIIKECVSILFSMFARVYFSEESKALRFEENHSRITHCVEYIKNHYNEKFSLSEISHRFAMSKSNFCSVFSSVTGSSFKNFLNSYRIKKSMEMILNGEKISNVARLCGYDDFSTFYRNFKKQTGISPTEFLENSHIK